MLKLNFTTMATPKLSGAEVIRAARKLGYQGVDLRVSDYYGELTLKTSPAELSALKRTFDSEGIVASGLFCYNEFGCSDTGSWHKMEESIFRHIDLASKIGALSIRIIPGDPSLSESPDDFIKKTAETLINVLEADKSNIDLIIENHVGQFLLNDSVNLIAMVRNPRLGLGFSPDNCFVAQEDMDFDLVSDITKQFFISDYKKVNEDYIEVLAGNGEVPLKDAFKSIGGSDFKGWVTFKYGKVWEEYLEEPEVSLPFFIKNYKEILGIHP